MSDSIMFLKIFCQHSDLLVRTYTVYLYNAALSNTISQNGPEFRQFATCSNSTCITITFFCVSIVYFVRALKRRNYTVLHMQPVTF